jgi:prepilin-type N-terminal cleavage/methylation domain-containing protein
MKRTAAHSCTAQLAGMPHCGETKIKEESHTKAQRHKGGGNDREGAGIPPCILFVPSCLCVRPVCWQSMWTNWPAVPRMTDNHIRRSNDGRGCPSYVIRSGFTLIEMLIAVSLSLVLISAIYSAVSLHWKYEKVGRERIDRAQVSLAVLRLLTEDVGSVMYTPPSNVSQEEEESAEATTSAATSSSTSTTAATTTTPDDASTTTDSTQASLGIVGTADQLQLDISQPAREDFVPDESNDQSGTSLPATSDSVRVTWGLITPTTALPDDSGRRSLTVNPALARQLADRLRGVVEVEEDASNTVALSDASILAREVVSLQFRYYDGYAWVTEWDSVIQERLPLAIEVTIGFIKQDYKQPGSLNLPGQVTIIPIKHVIHVPSSTPVSGEEI